MSPRGIGEKTVEQLREYAREHQCSLWQAIQQLVEHRLLNGRACNALNAFMLLVEQLEIATADLPLHQCTRHVIEHSGLLTYHKEEKGEKGQSRVENLEELITAAQAFSYQQEEGEELLPPLVAFLDHAVLEAGETQAEQHEDSVQLMTLHSAKAEFPLVFMAGMEEGCSAQDEYGRRWRPRRRAPPGLCRHHRAMQQLYLTCAEAAACTVRKTTTRNRVLLPRFPPSWCSLCACSRAVPVAMVPAAACSMAAVYRIHPSPWVRRYAIRYLAKAWCSTLKVPVPRPGCRCTLPARAASG